MAFGSVGKAKIELSLDAKKAIKELGNIKKQTAATTREMAASFDRVKAKFNGISRAGKVAFVAIGGAMTGASIAAAKFEKEMANVSTMLFGVSNDLLPELSRGVLDMSMEFGEGTATLSKGLYDILSAGIEASKSMDVLAVSAQAAAAGMTDTGVAADAITTILNSYQLEADQAEAVSDKLFATVARGKCLTGETKVLLSDGQYVRIDSLNNGEDYEVISWDYRTFMPTTARFVDMGTKQTVLVTTKTGRKISTTPEHPYLTPDGWKEVSELSPGDRIAVPSALPFFGRVKPKAGLPELLGLLLAEGSISSGSPRLTIGNEYTEKIMVDGAEKYGIKFNKISQKPGKCPAYNLVNGKQGHNGNNPLIDDLRRMGLWGTNCHSKFVPEEVYTWDRKSIAMFLRAYFTGDGWFCGRHVSRRPGAKSKGQYVLGVCSVSEDLLRGMAHLLLRFGINGTIRYKKEVNAWVWESKRYVEIKRFLQYIGIDRDGETEEKFNQYTPESNSNKYLTSYGKPPLPKTEYYPWEGVRNYKTQIFYDPIKAIEYKDEQRVYDLTVPTLQNFVANDVVAHNTTFNQLAPAIGMVASTAAQSGLSLDEMSGALATATRNGVRTEIAVTGLNAILATFLKSSDKSKEAAAKFGIELSSEALKAEGLAGILSKLSDARAEDVAAIFENRRALRVIMPLLGDMEGLYSDIELAANSAGLSQEAFAKIADTLSKNFDRLKQTGMALLVTVGDMINDFIQATGILDTLQGAIKGLIDWFNSFEPSTRRLIAAVGVLALALAGLAAFSGVVLGAFAALLAGGVLPLVAAIVGVGGLVGAAALLSSGFGDVAADAEHLGQQFDQLRDKATGEIRAHNEQQKSLAALADEYDRLDAQLADASGEKRAEIEKKLADLAQKIAKEVPNATTAWNKYGEAIRTNTGDVRAFMDMSETMFRRTMELRKAEYDVLVLRGQTLKTQWETELGIHRTRLANLELEAREAQRVLKEWEDSYEEFMLKEYGVQILSDAQMLNIRTAQNEIARLSPLLQESGLKVAELEAALAKVKLDEATREELGRIILEMKVVQDEAGKTGEALEKIGGEEATANVRTLAEAYNLVNKAVSELPTPLQRAEEGFKKAYDAAVKLAEEGKEGTKEFSQALDEMSSAVDELSSQLDTYYNDLRENSGWTTDAVISDIERRMAAERAAHGEASALYVSLGQKLVTEQEKANSAYVKIWDDTVSSINRGMEDMISEIIKGNKSIGDAFKDLGKVIVDSFIDAFAKSIVEKIGFDALFKNNIFGLAGFFESTIGGLFSGGAAAVTSGAAGVAAGETGALAGTGLYTSGIATPGVSFAAAPPEWFAGTTAEWTASMGELSAAQTQVIANQGVLGGLFSEFGSTIAGTVTPIVVVTAAIDGMVQGTEEFNKALDDGVDTWEGLSHAATGAATIVNPVGARMAASLNKATLEAIGLNEGLANVGSRMAEFAVMGSVIPIIGTAIGGVVGGLVGLAENLGVIKHGTTGLQDHAMKLQDVADGYSTVGEVIGQMRQYTFGELGLMSSVDAAKHGADLLHLMEDDYEKRMEWYQKYVEQTGMFTEAELAEVKDMLSLWETDTENAAGRVREAYRTAAQDMSEAMRWVDDDLKDIASGWDEAFRKAWEQAAAGSGTLAGNFQSELSKLPGMTEEGIAGLLEVLEKSGGSFEAMAEHLGVSISTGIQQGLEDTQIQYGGLLFDDQDKLIEDGKASGAAYRDGFEQALSVSATGDGELFYGGLLLDEDQAARITEGWGVTGDQASRNYAQKFEEGSLTDDDLEAILADDKLLSSIIDAWAETGLLSSEGYRMLFEENSLTAEDLRDILAGDTTLNEIIQRWAETGSKAAQKYAQNFGQNSGTTTGVDTFQSTGSDILDDVLRVRGYAGGTNFFPGGWGLVGEEGPEMVRLPRGSQIIPSGLTGVTLGYGAVRIYTGAIHTAADERDLERRLTGKITRSIESAMARI